MLLRSCNVKSALCTTTAPTPVEAKKDAKNAGTRPTNKTKTAPRLNTVMCAKKRVTPLLTGRAARNGKSKRKLKKQWLTEICLMPKQHTKVYNIRPNHPQSLMEASNLNPYIRSKPLTRTSVNSTQLHTRRRLLCPRNLLWMWLCCLLASATACTTEECSGKRPLTNLQNQMSQFYSYANNWLNNSTESIFMATQPTNNELKILQWNCRSMSAKIPEILQLATSTQAKVILMQEPKQLYPNKTLGEFYVVNGSTIPIPLTLTLIHKSMCYVVIDRINDPQEGFENTVVDIGTSSGGPIRIINSYIRPQGTPIPTNIWEPLVTKKKQSSQGTSTRITQDGIKMECRTNEAGHWQNGWTKTGPPSSTTVDLPGWDSPGSATQPSTFPSSAHFWNGRRHGQLKRTPTAVATTLAWSTSN